MNIRSLVPLFCLALLPACASLTPPPAAQLERLPIVSYPDAPPSSGDFIYRLPAGRDIEVRLLADGNLLAAGVDQSITSRLTRDLYLHKRWASEDGKLWVPADKLVGVHLTVTLPSYETPGPGRIHLSVNRKDVK